MTDRASSAADLGSPLPGLAVLLVLVCLFGGLALAPWGPDDPHATLQPHGTPRFSSILWRTVEAGDVDEHSFWEVSVYEPPGERRCVRFMVYPRGVPHQQAYDDSVGTATCGAADELTRALKGDASPSYWRERACALLRSVSTASAAAVGDEERWPPVPDDGSWEAGECVSRYTPWLA